MITITLRAMITMITDDSNDVYDYNDSKRSPCLEHTELLSVGEPELVVRLPGKLDMIMVIILK